jgi:hypothetical protein
MNIWQSFESLLAEVPGAQTALADTVRALVYKSDPSLFERLDFEDDHTFLEPTLFAYFTAPDSLATRTRARCTRRFTGCSRSARSCGSCRPAWRIESCRIGSGTRRSAASRST